jgi:hypothetical protein
MGDRHWVAQESMSPYWKERKEKRKREEDKALSYNKMPTSK